MKKIIDMLRGHSDIQHDEPGLENCLVFRRFNAAQDGALYNLWRRDAWRCAHGTETGYEDIYLAYAAVRSKNDPDSVRIALYDGEPCGLLELDTKRNALKGGGWISFFYIAEKFRGKGLGRSLMKQAEHIYKQKGRRRIELCAAEDNHRALGFYEHLGFTKTGEEMGVLGPLFIFAKDIK